MPAKIKNAARQAGRRPKHKPRGISHHAFEKVYWPYLPVVLVIVFLLSFSFPSGGLQAAIRPPAGKVLDYATSMSINGLLSSTNDARTSNGVASLTLNDKLDAAAQAKANDMASRNYWSHNTPEGNPPWVFVNNQGYSYQKLGENLATGFSDEQAAINGWLSSPSHRANMLDSAFLEVGFGFANNPDYTSAGGGPQTIVVAFYGKPAGATQPVSQSTSPPAPRPPVSRPTAPAPPPPPVAAASPTAPPAPASSPQPSNPQPLPVTGSQPRPSHPVTTDSPTKGITLSFRTSRAQVAFAKLPAANFATGLMLFGIFATVGLWISRHAWMLRRALVYGETFAVKHPLFDVGLLVIAGLSYLLSQTAGFVL